MSNSQVIAINLNKPEDVSKANSQAVFDRIYPTSLAGRGAWHSRHWAGFGYEYQEHYGLQHNIVVHLQPEPGSLRRLGDRVESENVAVGDVAIIPAYVNHWQRFETELVEGFVSIIEPRYLSNLACDAIDSERFAPFGCDRLDLMPTFSKSDSLIQGIALNIKAELESDCYDKLYVESLYNTLNLHLIKHYVTRKFDLKEYRDGLPPYKLKQALDYIHSHLDEKIELGDLAKLLNISQYYFCRLFRQSMGVAPYQYVIEQRINRAKSLLKQRNLSLVEIALECGFCNQSQMTRHFRQQMGITPKVYRDSF